MLHLKGLNLFLGLEQFLSSHVYSSLQYPQHPQQVCSHCAINIIKLNLTAKGLGKFQIKEIKGGKNLFRVVLWVLYLDV